MMADFIEELIRNSPQWIFHEVPDDEIEKISKRFSFSKIVSKILYLRGVRTEEDLRHYLHDDFYELYNPFQFTQMHTAMNRVKKALHEGERVFIFGDRDVDGVLSTAMLHNALKRFDGNVLSKVPEGEYGYGIEKKDIEYASQKNVKLIITVDTGISSAEEISYASSLGIDTIVIDHHVQTGVVPYAHAILNPKMEFETYPFKDLSAGGVVLKFIHALILSYTKNFNKLFVPLLPAGEILNGAKVKNGIVEEYFQFQESIHYPIDSNCTIVLDSEKMLPQFFKSWLRDQKIDQLNIICSKTYASIQEFASHFVNIFMRKQKRSADFVQSFIDLSAISTISDIMPLCGENRTIVKEGLQQILHTQNTGLSVLLSYCNLPERDIKAKDIAWSVSPIINSAGRMGEAQIAVDLFTTEDTRHANELSKVLIELNEKRKEKGEKNFSIIKPMIEDNYYKDPVIVLDTDRAEHGVTGIIASKIARKFSKPAIIIVNDGDIGIGSGRGGENFDLISLILKCEDLLLKYGGHRSAIGFTIEIDKINTFRRRINEIIQNDPALFHCQEVIEIEDVLSPDGVNFHLLNELGIFEPTGIGNPDPNFSIMKTAVINPASIGKEKNHLRFFIPSKNGTIPVIGWGLADKGLRILKEGCPVDIVFSLQDNYYRGERSIQLVLHDIRLS